jgi:hypothetical protein
MRKKRKSKSSTMILYHKYFQAAEIDLKAAKLLVKEKLFPSTLYHLQQAYEKSIKSYYIFRLTSDGVSDERASKKCKELGHDTEKVTIKLLAVLTQMDIDAMQKARKELTDPARKQQPDPNILKIVDDGLTAIKGFKASIGRMVKRNDLETKYIENVRNFPRFVQKCYEYNQKSSSREDVLEQPGQNSLLLDIAMITLYPCLYKMEEITRYPHDVFSYDNFNLLSTNMREPCQKIIEMMDDLFSLVKTGCKPGGRNILNLPS